ncbi:MAG: magnesium transporter [Chloroflexota bacterium]|nr:magnesium transporter [Chloroflexota bacterium]
MAAPHTHSEPLIDEALQEDLATIPGAPEEIRVAAVREGKLREWTGEEAIAALDAGGPADPKAPETVVWIDLTAPAPTFVARIAASLGLHPLIAEDIVEGNQRAKVETTDGLVHVVLFELDYEGRTAVTREIDLVLGDGFLLSAHPVEWDPRAGGHGKGGLESVMRAGPDHMLWAVFDKIVDSYFPFADRLEEVVDRLQNEVVDKPDRRTLDELFSLKRDLIAVRRAVSPVREILNEITNRDLKLIDTAEVIYFRDIYDHIIRLTDELDNYRELASATLDVYLSTINNNLSVIMKRLTGVTVILAGVGAIAGLFGMSEAGTALGGKEAGGFWLITAITIALAAGAAVFLRKIDWI